MTGLCSLQTQACSNVVEDVDVVVDTTECALARSLGKDRDIGQRVHALVSGDRESSIDQEASDSVDVIYKVF